jgi:hypothetical protein
MNDRLLVDRRTGESIEFGKATESMYDADVDAVGMWQIVPEGRDRYGLEGDDLAKFIRLSLLYMFARGAKPVVMRSDADHWVLKDYGDTPEAMVHAIIAEWLAAGAPTPKPYDSLWFALPHIYSPSNKFILPSAKG